ncbi:hypothetical protein [Porphyromonas somerae]|uniref:hypothetical protein n=1 Tax=Porphyromonas somerae TaxID=322095 RepID=UPI002A7F10B2|nr:hypothetical protein [Porphyromonas somerae]MDY3884220.1 hypothetical protein [Porphyromonas somerae]
MTTFIIKEQESGKFFFSLNSDNRIDVARLFGNELAEGGQGFDDLQFFNTSNTDIEGFDADDVRRALFAEVEEGGALLYDCNSGESVAFTAKEMSEGSDSFGIGVYSFDIVADED